MRSLVIGGVGFLGSHIVEALKNRVGSSDQVIGVLDIVKPPDDEVIAGVEYHEGDIVDEARTTEVLNSFRPDVVFHTASPVHGLPDQVYYRVNDQGTRSFLSSCRAASVKNVVYTSSTGVVWTGTDISGATEDQLSIPKQGYDAYHHTKAIAERLVLDQNGKDGMHVVVLRPCGMTGERDKQMIWRMAQAFENGQHNVQIGDNTNPVDYVYAGNVAYAHVLAGEQLLSNPDQVAGETFFVTNGQPMPQWDFHRLVFRELGDDGSKKIMVIPRWLGMIMATIAELWSKITGTPVDLTRFTVKFVTGVQWYNIDKARKLLNYDPPVSLEEGVKRTVSWWKQSGAAKHKARKADSKKTV